MGDHQQGPSSRMAISKDLLHFKLESMPTYWNSLLNGNDCWSMRCWSISSLNLSSIPSTFSNKIDAEIMNIAFCRNLMHAGCFKFTNQCNKFPQDPNMVQNQAKRFFKVDLPNQTFTESYSSFLLKVSGLPYCLITSRNRDRLVVTLFGICFTGRNLWILEASLALPT